MLPKVFRIGLLALLLFMLCFFVIPGVGLFMSAFYLFIGLFILITCFAVFGPIVIVALSYFCTTHRLEATVQQVFHRKSSLDTRKTIRFVRIVFAGTRRSMNWRSESLKLGESITILKRGWVFILKHDGVCRTQIVFQKGNAAPSNYQGFQSVRCFGENASYCFIAFVSFFPTTISISSAFMMFSGRTMSTSSSLMI